VFLLQVCGDHDWYCFECHGPGDVLECSECWRVYHPHCVKSPASVFVCPVCKVIIVVLFSGCCGLVRNCDVSCETAVAALINRHGSVIFVAWRITVEIR